MKFTVIKGLGQGRGLGFPTINFLRPAGFKLAQGVYACFVKIGAKNYRGALYYGPKYNFGVLLPCLEVHLIGFKGAVRARRTEIDIVKKIRNVRKFDSIDSMKKQIKFDIAKIKKILKNAHKSA